MKFALILLMALIGTAYQQHYLVRRPSWVSPYVVQPGAYNTHRANINPVWMLNHHAAQQNDGEIELVSDNEPQQPNWFGDVQARGPILHPGVDSYDPRFFFGGLGGGLSIENNNNNNNGINAMNIPFLRTKAVLVTGTLETTLVSSCVPASEFSVAGPPACRRRKRGVYERFLFAENGESISPSTVEKSETTAMSDIVKERNAKVNELLESSKDDIIVENENESLSNRQKRFFFAMTTTITSYSLRTVMSTQTVKLLAMGTSSALTCLPRGFILC